MADRVGRLLMLLATVLFFFMGLLPILYFAPRKGTFETLSGMGSFTAGAWALGAGVLAVFAAWSISERERERRRIEVTTICLVEIQSFWRHLQESKTVHTLALSTGALQSEVRIPVGLPSRRKDTDPIETYKGHLGQDWLSLAKTPDVFGALPMELAHPVLDFYSRGRSVLDRLNWMNDQEYTMVKAKEVSDRQERTLDDLVGLEAKYKKITEALAVVIGSR